MLVVVVLVGLVSGGGSAVGGVGEDGVAAGAGRLQ